MQLPVGQNPAGPHKNLQPHYSTWGEAIITEIDRMLQDGVIQICRQDDELCTLRILGTGINIEITDIPIELLKNKKNN